MKKKFKVITMLCVICSLKMGQSVLAGDKLFLSQDPDYKLECMAQGKIEKENRIYRENVKMTSKINIQHRIQTINYASTIHKTLSDKEIQVLTRIVEAEATDKDMKSKILVANVILNRVASKEFPDTVEEVVFQRVQGKVQFSPTSDGRYWSVSITKSSQESVRRALEGADDSEGALYFVEKTMANPHNVSWFESSLHHLFTYEGHSFYK